MTKASLKKGFAGGIEVERDMRRIKKCIDPNVRLLGVDVRPGPGCPHELVTDRIFDAQGDKIQARQRAATGADFHFNGPRWKKPLSPWHGESGRVDVLFRAVGKPDNFEQDATGDAAFKIRPVHGLKRAIETTRPLQSGP